MAVKELPRDRHRGAVDRGVQLGGSIVQSCVKVWSQPLHDLAKFPVASQLCPCPRLAFGDVGTEELVEGAQPMLLKQFKCMEQADGQPKVTFNRP